AAGRNIALSVENGGTVIDQLQVVNAQAVNVSLEQGQNTISGSVTDVAGNSSSMVLCLLVVGTPPVVAWYAPTASISVVNAAAAAPSTDSLQDADAAAAGWQGVLQVTVSNLETGEIDEGAVQFYINGAAFGEPQPLSGA